jgi:hypothetical protein
MPDDDLFDWAGKADGMGRADDHADVDWKTAADDALVEAARTRREITTDDVMRLIDPRAETHDLRALGPVMRRGAQLGLIEPANTIGRPCARGARHASRLMVWRSLIYEAPAALAVVA